VAVTSPEHLDLDAIIRNRKTGGSLNIPVRAQTATNAVDEPLKGGYLGSKSLFIT
jgi:hypothetical protein